MRNTPHLNINNISNNSSMIKYFNEIETKSKSSEKKLKKKT